MDGRSPLVLERQGRVLIHARDEAHRFVNPSIVSGEARVH